MAMRRFQVARVQAPPVPEKVEQEHICQLLGRFGKVYVLGHPSPADGRTHRGTGQTPGLPDVRAFLRSPRDGAGVRVLLEVEVKRRGGRLRPEQAEYRALCLMAGVAHVVGTLDDVIAWLMEHAYLKPDGVAHYRRPQP